MSAGYASSSTLILTFEFSDLVRAAPSNVSIEMFELALQLIPSYASRKRYTGVVLSSIAQVADQAMRL